MAGEIRFRITAFALLAALIRAILAVIAQKFLIVSGQCRSLNCVPRAYVAGTDALPLGWKDMPAAVWYDVTSWFPFALVFAILGLLPWHFVLTLLHRRSFSSYALPPLALAIVLLGLQPGLSTPVSESLVHAIYSNRLRHGLLAYPPSGS